MNESKTDEEHILYMLDGSDRGRIEGLHEAQESWGFGGGVDIHKERPIVRMGDEFFALRRRTEFYVEGLTSAWIAFLNERIQERLASQGAKR